VEKANGKNCYRWLSAKKGFCLIGMLLLLAVASNAQASKKDVRESMVKIYSVQNSPDYNNPWNMTGPVAVSGSGCIIKGNRILTNAHVVSDHTFIQVRLHGKSKKYEATVVAASHEADLALLSVADKDFFEGAAALQFGPLPEIQQEAIVYGFPEGGDTLSITKGVISRTEHIYYAHSLIELLATQLDAAVNPGNSGGPVMIENRIVGVVMGTRRDSDNIGYMIPPPIIEHFLTDIADGYYDGFPDDGIILQNMENEGLKKMYGFKDDQSGALVRAIVPGTPSDGKLHPGDVILSVENHPVADDCTVEFRPNERTSLKYYIQRCQIGDNLKLTILRNGRENKISLPLTRAWGNSRLVPMTRYDVSPTYYVYGGLVFCPLTLNYLQANDWRPSNLLNYFVNQILDRKGEEVVIITKILPSNINNGYQEFVNDRIIEVNGQKILNLVELIKIIEGDPEDPFVVLKTESGRIIGLDRDEAQKEHRNILRSYRIASDRSADLELAAENLDIGDKKRAEIKPPDKQKITLK
jgi:S1-C subfamily serine protease